MYALAIAVAFWILIGHALLTGEERRGPVALAAVWLAIFALGRFVPSLATASTVARAIVFVVTALWMKIAGRL